MEKAQASLTQTPIAVALANKQAWLNYHFAKGPFLKTMSNTTNTTAAMKSMGIQRIIMRKSMKTTQRMTGKTIRIMQVTTTLT